MLFINQEERRASDMVLSTSENNDISNQSVDTSFFTSEKNRMTNQLASLARRDYRKDSCISSTFLLKFWAKNRGCGLYTRPLFLDRINWLVVVTN